MMMMLLSFFFCFCFSVTYDFIGLDAQCAEGDLKNRDRHGN